MTGSRKRFLSWIVFIAFMFVIIGSSCFIIHSADHDCTGEDCLVCMEIAQCQSILHASGNVPAAALSLCILTGIILLLTAAGIGISSVRPTLISLKVELLN